MRMRHSERAKTAKKRRGGERWTQKQTKEIRNQNTVVNTDQLEQVGEIEGSDGVGRWLST